MRTRTLCVALVAAGLSVSPAAYGASEAPATYTYADGMLREAAAVGLTYWEARGFTPPPPDLRLYDYTDADARADTSGSGRIWIDRGYRDRSWRVYTNRRLSIRLRRSVLEDVCQVTTHEEGHTLGSELLRLGPLDSTGHEARGLMSLAVHDTRVNECVRWARAKLPSRPRRHRRRGHRSF